MKKNKHLLPQYMWLPIFLTFAMNSIAYNGSRLFTAGRFHFNLTTKFDDMIPTVPSTVLIYIGCFLVWGINYILGCRQEKDIAYRFISADFFAKIICMIIFLVLPTTNVRPVVTGDSFWNQALLLLYNIDAPDNLFPSIHCLTGWFCFIAVRKNSTVPKAYKVVSLVIALFICGSTLTTKQHVLLDVIGGVALAEFSYWFVEVSSFKELYKRLLGSRVYVQKN